ncbi:MAG: hypothetical protein RL456_1036 [Pseudomonadota bacterium]|jgi:sugar lactone lactonase YvrE
MHATDEPAVRAASAPCLLGESPMWHPQQQALYWCDIPGRRIHRLDPATGQVRQWDMPVEPASLAPRLDGRLLVAMRDGLWCFDPETGRRDPLVLAPYDTAVERFNDGKCDPQGRFWVGTIYEPRTPALAALYRWSDGRLDRCADGVTVANGLGWSLDGRTMWWADTKAHVIHAFDFDPADGSLSRRRPFVAFPPRDPAQPLDLYGGRPDGAAVDAEGCLWVAMFEGGRLLRLAPSGEILREVRLPVRCPTMPCFGGADLRTLYVTTAREKRPAQELAAQPLAGCVLALPVDVPGLPVHFAHA